MANYGFGSGSGSGSGSGYQSYIPPTPEIDYGVTLPATISPQPAIDQATTTLASIQSAVNAAIQNCIATPASVKGQVDACVSMIVEQAISDNSVFLNSLGGLAQTAISNLYNAAQEYAMPFLSGQKTAIATATPIATTPTQPQSTSGESIGAAFYWGGPNGPNSGIVHANFNPNSPAGYYYWNGSAWTTTQIAFPDAPTSGPSGPLPPSPPPPVVLPQTSSSSASVENVAPGITCPYGWIMNPYVGKCSLIPPPGTTYAQSEFCSQGKKLLIGSDGAFYFAPGFSIADSPIGPCQPDTQPVSPPGPLPPNFPTGPLPPPQETPCPPVPVVKVETCRTYDLITDIIRGQLSTEKDILTAYLGGTVKALLESATLADADAALYKLTPHLDPSDIVPSNPNDLVSLTIEG